jgi:hypothetical protein
MCGIWCVFDSSVDTHQQIPSCVNIAHRGCYSFLLILFVSFFILPRNSQSIIREAHQDQWM